jgi:hypothetical protein
VEGMEAPTRSRATRAGDAKGWGRNSRGRGEGEAASPEPPPPAGSSPRKRDVELPPASVLPGSNRCEEAVSEPFRARNLGKFRGRADTGATQLGIASTFHAWIPSPSKHWNSLNQIPNGRFQAQIPTSKQTLSDFITGLETLQGKGWQPFQHPNRPLVLFPNFFRTRCIRGSWSIRGHFFLSIA